MEITLYSLPEAQCVRCRGASIALRNRKIDYDKVMINESPDALAFVKSLGYESAPVIVVRKDGEVVDHFGFVIDKIDGLKVAA